jgi:hypothetical protein
MFADDVALIAFDSPQHAQQLLDCLGLFCDIFGMKVNLSQQKTCFVVFRKSGSRVPQGLVLQYKGQEVPRVQCYDYLGVRFHETRGTLCAAEQLAASGERAMHAMLRACRVQHITQFDIKCRVFDIKVESVMSYAAHVWGPELFHKFVIRGYREVLTPADKVHVRFLRQLAGVGKSVHMHVLYRDFGRSPIMFHWVVLACRWWNRLRDMLDDEQHICLAKKAWQDNVEMMLAGCKQCWSYYLLSGLQALGLVTAAEWNACVSECCTQSGPGL